jgi:RimJ/RimL family protein N-acetyltransferase
MQDRSQSKTFNLQPTLSDSLLTLEPLLASDFERLFVVASDPLIWEMHPTRDRYKREVFQQYFDGAVESQSAFLIFEKSSDDLIGSSRYYDVRPDESRVAIGYTFLARRFWGGTYNGALKRLMIDYAFQNFDTVYFHIGATNLRSQKAILKIGAVKVNEVDFDYYGSKLLHFEYAIRKSDWV